MRIAVVDESEARCAVLEEGLRDAGYRDITRVHPQGGYVAKLHALSPDVVIIDLGTPSRDSLEEMLIVSRALDRPIAMFVDHSDDAMIGAAIDAGVSAYVVDGLQKDRVKPIIELAIRRFNAFARLQRELTNVRGELAERKLIDKAKHLLMNSRSLSETEAYAMLRSTAMRQSRKIAEVADALITAHSLLSGDRS